MSVHVLSMHHSCTDEKRENLVFDAIFRHYFRSTFRMFEPMAALDTFEWYVARFYPNPTDQDKEVLAKERRYLLNVRNENERLRHIETLLETERERSTRVPA